MPHNLASRSQLKRQLWRLVLAKLSVGQAKKACEYLARHEKQMDDETYEALVAGILVLYSRPFGENNGLGCLPRKFGRFRDPSLQNTHETILMARNHFVAHSDATYKLCDEMGKEKDELLKLELVVNFGEDGLADCRTQVVGPRLSAKTIPIIKSLCDELLKSLGAEESALVQKLFEGRPMHPGRNCINISDES